MLIDPANLDKATSQRIVWFKNNTANDIPAFAAMEVEGTEILNDKTSSTGTIIYKVKQPTADGTKTIIFNLAQIVPASKRGLATYDYPLQALYDSSVVAVAAGQFVGVKASNWKLFRVEDGGLQTYMVEGPGAITALAVVSLLKKGTDIATGVDTSNLTITTSYAALGLSDQKTIGKALEVTGSAIKNKTGEHILVRYSAGATIDITGADPDQDTGDTVLFKVRKKVAVTELTPLANAAFDLIDLADDGGVSADPVIFQYYSKRVVTIGPIVEELENGESLEVIIKRLDTNGTLIVLSNTGWLTVEVL